MARSPPAEKRPEEQDQRERHDAADQPVGKEDAQITLRHQHRLPESVFCTVAQHERERRWATLDEVPRLVVDPGLARVMRDAADLLATEGPAAWMAASPSSTS